MTTQKTPALTVNGLVKTFDVSAPWLNRVIERKPRQFVQAVNDIDFTVPAGGCLSIVGESGCGKSTVARLVTGLHRPSGGEVRFAPGRSGAPLSAQMIFQDPYASLNPRWRVKNIIAEPLRELKGRGAFANRRTFRLGRREIPARVFRRAASAHFDRPGAGERAGVSRLRRADFGARRLGAGAGSEPHAPAAG
jgi:ABC-type glutathione transport system ATPase component